MLSCVFSNVRYIGVSEKPKEPEKPPEPEPPQDPKDCKIVAGRDTIIEFQKEKDKGIGFTIAGGSDTPCVRFLVELNYFVIGSLFMCFVVTC